MRKRMHDVAKKRHFITKVSCKNFSVLVWTKWNRLRLRRFQTTVFCLNVLQRQNWQHFAKNKRLLRTELLLIQSIFTEYARKFANASYEPHYAVSERHLVFLHICKMVLQNNRWFYAFVCLVRNINWNNVETTANVVS